MTGVQTCALPILTHFRAVNKDKLIKALQTLVNRFGYFKVLLNLEQSQLYQIYIDSGKKMLAETGSDNKDLMTKEEFESFSDMLHGIQINT